MPLRLLVLLLVAAIAVTSAAEEPIDRALRLHESRSGLLLRGEIRPQWLPDGQAFWYRTEREPRAVEYVLIEAETGTRRSAATLRDLGLPPGEAIRTSNATLELSRSQRTGEAMTIRFRNRLESDIQLFWLNPEGEQIPYSGIGAKGERTQNTFDGHVWLIASSSGERLAVIEAQAGKPEIEIDGKGRSADDGEGTTARSRAGRNPGSDSPDGLWNATVAEGRVTLRDRKTGELRHLEAPSGGSGPLHGPALWAPDSTAFVVSRAEKVPTRRVTIVESSPKNGGQPGLIEFDYAKPGDPLPKPRPVLFRIGGGVGQDGEKEFSYQSIEIKSELFSNPFTESPRIDVRWAPDSSEFTFHYDQRGHQVYRIIAVDARTGAARIVVEETSETFIDSRTKTWRHWLSRANDELLWMSERDGWCHLWLYDARAGRVKNRLTSGSWVVREVLHVDELAREVWFLASGLRTGEDPYHRHLCRVGIDGRNFRQLTEGDGNHKIQFSPDRRFFIDTWSRVDQPPVHELRRSRDGSLVCALETGDASRLTAAGWTVPERFTAPGRDGTTEIHGILIKPTDFDPSKSYPVVEEIYAGPHSAFVPKDFQLLPRQHAIAELGFIVVQIDGMGTNHRGKAFHDVCWKNLKDAGLPDRMAWIRAAAKTRPWMDLSRVGIYGGSAGGQSAMRAVLDHHDFYKVAVADCGCHDNRMDKIWWNEQWMGWPVDASYAASSNVDDAHRLGGKLLLIVGELDRNVDPASTMQVVGALQKAGKMFDFVPIAGAGHGAAETPYGSRVRMEFLARHLGSPSSRAPASP